MSSSTQLGGVVPTIAASVTARARVEDTVADHAQWARPFKHRR
jgi:hypothetical protein